MDLFAEVFQSTGLNCLAYDHRGFGASDTAPGAPRLEIIPSQQLSDWSDAITYAQSRQEVDPKKVGVWVSGVALVLFVRKLTIPTFQGSSYSGGHVIQLGATDKRVKAVSSQAPFVSGSLNFGSLIRSDFIASMNEAFENGKWCQLELRVVVNIFFERPSRPGQG